MRRRLQLARETVRTLAAPDLIRARGGLATATDGQGNCESELSDCPTHAWSCVNVSCTDPSDRTGQ